MSSSLRRRRSFLFFFSSSSLFSVKLSKFLCVVIPSVWRDWQEERRVSQLRVFYFCSQLFFLLPVYFEAQVCARFIFDLARLSAVELTD